MTEAAMNEQQREILRLSRAASSRAWHQSISLHLRGSLDELTLVSALESLVSQHPVLRLTVKAERAEYVCGECGTGCAQGNAGEKWHGWEDSPGRDGHGHEGPGCDGLGRDGPGCEGPGCEGSRSDGPGSEPNRRLIVKPTLLLPLECRDLSWLNAVDLADEWKSILRHDVSAPFDLYRGPLFRMLLARMSAHHHVLVFTAHPVIAGQASIRSMMTKLAGLYAPTGDNRPAVDGQRTVDHLSLRGALQAPEAAKHLHPAATRLTSSSSTDALQSPTQKSDSVAPSLLPTDFPRPSECTYASAAHSHAAHSHWLSAELSSILRRDSSGREGGGGAGAASMSSLAMFAALILWLHRTTGQQELVCGVHGAPSFAPAPAASGPAASGLALAPEDSLLPVRSLLLPGDSVVAFRARLVKSLKEAGKSATSRKFSLGSAGSSAFTPCATLDPEAPRESGFSAGYGWAYNQFHFESDEKPFRFGDLQAELVWNARTSTPADISFSLRSGNGNLSLDCDYNAALFKGQTVARWAGEIERLLRVMLEQPEQPLAEILWLSSAERHALLIDLNRTGSAYPRDSSIQELFERQVLRTPDTIALVNEEGTLTYAELNEKANQLARFLRRYGVRRGERIALVVERSLGSVVGALATLKTGCAYVPIDATQPAQHVQQVIRHSQPAAILSQAQFASLFRDQNGRDQNAPVVLLDEDWAAVATEALENLALPIAAESPASVLYRGDAAGNLRGVVLPHRAFVRLVQGSDYLDFGRGEVFLQLARSTENAWALEVWGPLLNGGQIAMLPPGWQAPVQIGSAIEHYGATTLWLKPGDLHPLIAGHIEALAPLKQIVTGNGTFSPALMARLLERYPRLKLLSGFGPVENGTFTCWNSITLKSIKDACLTSGHPVGRPSANTRVYILDEKRELVRLGVPGEMHVAGDGLATAYLHSPELTDQRFFMHSFSPLLRERLFRTGCLARYREGGRIEVLGTIDTQIRVDSSAAEKDSFMAHYGTEATENSANELDGVEAAESFVID